MKAIDVVQKLIYGRQQYSPKVKNILRDYGNAVIQGATLNRKPVNKLITGALKIIGNLPYDELFHLSIIFHTNLGDILIEKNENINIIINPEIVGESLDINFPNITINEALHNTKHKMGEDYWKYSVVNNCQNFILNILESNNVYEGSDFIKQDTDYIFHNNPNLKRLFDNTVGLYERFDIAQQGGKIKILGDNGLYSDQLIKMLNKVNKPINGVYSKDLLPDKLNLGWYIVNMQDHNKGDGTHWVCFNNQLDKLFYYDSFGEAPPIQIMNKVKGELIYNKKQIQNINSSCCGYFCVCTIIYNYHPTEKNFNIFINYFNRNTSVNDEILKDLLKNKGL